MELHMIAIEYALFLIPEWTNVWVWGLPKLFWSWETKAIGCRGCISFVKVLLRSYSCDMNMLNFTKKVNFWKSALNEYCTENWRISFSSGFAIFVFPTQHLRLVTTVFLATKRPSCGEYLEGARGCEGSKMYPRWDQIANRSFQWIFTRKCWIWGLDFSPKELSLRKLGDERSMMLLFQGFFAQIFSDAPSVNEVIGIYLWDLLRSLSLECSWLRFLEMAGFRKKRENFEENYGSCSMTCHLLGEIPIW